MSDDELAKDLRRDIAHLKELFESETNQYVKDKYRKQLATMREALLIHLKMRRSK